MVLEHVAIFADGVAVKQVGAEPFRIARECVDEVVLVTTDEICAAIKDIFEDTRSIAEPAGALGVAGLKRYVEREGGAGRRFATIVSGANVNFDRLRHIAERAELGEHRESLLAVTIPERPGSLLRFCELIGNRSITEFNYRYSHDAHAHIFVGVEITDPGAGKQAFVDALENDGYPVLDLTDNEMAKLHVRYMVGGHAPRDLDEILLPLRFPGASGRAQALVEWRSSAAVLDAERSAHLAAGNGLAQALEQSFELRHAFAELADFGVHLTQLGPNLPIGCRDRNEDHHPGAYHRPRFRSHYHRFPDRCVRVRIQQPPQ